MSIPEFSSKLQANYTELANQYLDSIPVHSVEDFGRIKTALEILLKDNKVETDDENLANKISDLKELIDNPELYVQYQERYKQFQAIIKTRITAKIHEIEALSENEKQRYIHDQTTKNIQTQQNQAKMKQSESPKPGEDKHVVSEQNWLLHQQQVLNEQEFGTQFQHSLSQQAHSFSIPYQSSGTHAISSTLTYLGIAQASGLIDEVDHVLDTATEIVYPESNSDFDLTALLSQVLGFTGTFHSTFNSNHSES